MPSAAPAAGPAACPRRRPGSSSTAPRQARRENFKLAHELAHHLVDDDGDCPSWLADQPDPLRLLEEVCDLIATEVLIPQETITTVLGGHPPSAQTVASLHDTTVAFRTACAIAVANKLPCDGFVLLAERGTNEVFAGARARDTRPYAWRGDASPTPTRCVGTNRRR